MGVFFSPVFSLCRNEEYYNNGPLKSPPTENAGSRLGTRVDTLDMPTVSASEPDILRNEAQDAVHGLQYNVPSVSSHGFPSAAQPSGVEFGYPQGNTQLQNLSAFSSLLVCCNATYNFKCLFWMDWNE
jgi:hypothetical protein